MMIADYRGSLDQVIRIEKIISEDDNFNPIFRLLFYGIDLDEQHVSSKLLSTEDFPTIKKMEARLKELEK